MRSTSLFLWHLIFCYHVGFVTSFQQRRLLLTTNSAISYQSTTLEADDRPPTKCQQYHQHSFSTCLFGTAKDRHLAQWNGKYQDLVAFYKKHGHLEVKSADDSSLYSWMRAQRRRRKGVKGNSPLTNEQIELLEKVDFPWNPKRGRRRGLIEKQWMPMYEELSKFYAENGHFRVEYRGSLYRWVRLQRRRKKGKKGLAPLNDKQIHLLDGIDFVWDAKQPSGVSNEEKWAAKYEELAAFYQKHGHLKVEYQSSLYRWMCVQRNKRKGRKGFASLTDEQIQLLDEIDFPWSPPKGFPRNLGWTSKAALGELKTA